VRERVLSTRELNRALLARQLLLERSGLPLTRALERVAGLQAQYAPSGYVALWSRLRNVRRDDLTRALERRRAIQATLMRTTIHMVSAADYPLFAAGLRRSRRDWWLRVHRADASGIDMDRVAAVLRSALRNGPRRAEELKTLLASKGMPPMAWSGANLWVDMVRVPPAGTWEQRRADLYGLADGGRSSRRPTEQQGLAHLARRYLGGFGPAPPKDIAGWAGIPVGALTPALERLRLRRFRDPAGDVLFDLPGVPIPDADAPAPVRFLPTWEAALLVHARRTQILPEPCRALVFDTRTPHSLNTFLVDGAVAGSWRYERGRVRLEPFAPLPRRDRRALEEEGRALAAFHAEG
jgi:DNA glycosylase AlkZ-like